MKKLLTLFALLICFKVYAAFPLVKDYTELVNALESGELIRGVIFFQRCSHPTGLTTDEIKQFYTRLQSLGFNLSTYTHYFASTEENGSNEIEVSKEFFAITTIPSFGMIQHYIRLNFSSPNVLKISYNLIDPKKIHNYTLDFDCTFGTNALTDIFLYRVLVSGPSPSSANINADQNTVSTAADPLPAE